MILKRFWIVVIMLFSTYKVYAQQIYVKKVSLMGSDFTITVVANSKRGGEHFISLAIDEIKRIEALISSWKPSSQTAKINKMGYLKPVKVDKELFDLIQRGIHISKLTDGAFDITYTASASIWNFDGTAMKMPNKKSIKSHLSKVGYENIVLNDEDKTVSFKKKGVNLNFGAIGKGYAADKAKALLIENNVVGGVINASGDITAWGKKPNGDAWTVGIKNPFNNKKSYGTFPISNAAVVTSGNYYKYCIIDGKRYAHIIDPRTGMPTTGITSVTVFAPKGELADALATSIFVMGIDTGIHRINQLDMVDCIIVDENGKLHYSNKIAVEKIVNHGKETIK